jgi:tripartite-type tricarboxylate transporter receptor subunit TctC
MGGGEGQRHAAVHALVRLVRKVAPDWRGPLLARLTRSPSCIELEHALVRTGWQGVGAPRNTPAEIIDKLNKEINAGLADPRMKARIADFGYTVFASSPADFRTFIAAYTEKWAKVIKFSGAKIY